jgi:hypothetical protein
MIATKTAVLATAMIIGVVGISVAAAPQAAEAGSINTTRSNIKSGGIVQQDAEQACTNQALGQGGQQAVHNIEQNAAGDELQSDPIPDIDVKMGKNPGGAGAGPGISSEGDPTVDAYLSNDCSLEQNLAPEQNAESGDDFSTNEWDG